MWSHKSHGAKKANGLVAVAIDKDKHSQVALKWAVENLICKGRTLILIHVSHKLSPHPVGGHSTISDHSNAATSNLVDKQIRDLFLTFHCFCTRKDIHCFDVILEDMDVVKALSEYVSYAAIENLVLGASSRNGFMRKFKTSDIPSSVSRTAPDFCTVYAISKGKISAAWNASRSAPFESPLPIEKHANVTDNKNNASIKVTDKLPFKLPVSLDDKESNRSQNNWVLGRKSGEETSESDTDMAYADISFVSSGRPSMEQMSPVMYDYIDLGLNSGRISSCTDQSAGSIRLGMNVTDNSSQHDFSFISHDSGRTSCSFRSWDEMEAEMKRLKLELKQTMDLYSSACREALAAKQKALELQQLRAQEGKKEEEAHSAEEAATALVEEKARCKAALKAVEMQAKRRMSAELGAHKDADYMKRVLDALSQRNVRYRKYTIDEIEAATECFSESRKIGEGGYGPVFKCHLEHTPVAVKLLRPDATQGMLQFQQEVEVLSCIRHPNMVLLLGACPEYGCLVYEYMANGSLDDRLFRRGNTPALSWQQRFRIAAEIGTGLLFLHQTKPEPLVHRDLKPANILLDHNFTSKIGDVGLARLVPPSVTEDMTQFRMTSTAGTFCYIDPEYQQSGMLGVKSDVYSLGILFLQLITARPAMGLTHQIGEAIEKGILEDMLDPAVKDWPVDQALCFAKMALQCAELRRKDRPDLGKIVLPELNRLRELAEAQMANPFSHSPISQDVISVPAIANSGYTSSMSESGTSSLTIGKELKATEDNVEDS